MEHHLRERREFGRNVLLFATQEKGADPFAQVGRCIRVALGDWSGVALAEIGAPTKKAAIQKVELAPQFFESVFDRGACHRNAEVCVQAESSLGDLAVGVLDVLGFVEHDSLPLALRQFFDVEAQNRVARKRHLGLVVELSLRAVIGVECQTGAEAAHFVGPVEENTRRADH